MLKLGKFRPGWSLNDEKVGFEKKGLVRSKTQWNGIFPGANSRVFLVNIKVSKYVGQKFVSRTYDKMFRSFKEVMSSRTYLPTKKIKTLMKQQILRMLKLLECMFTVTVKCPYSKFVTKRNVFSQGKLMPIIGV